MSPGRGENASERECSGEQDKFPVGLRCCLCFYCFCCSSCYQDCRSNAAGIRRITCQARIHERALASISSIFGLVPIICLSTYRLLYSSGNGVSVQLKLVGLRGAVGGGGGDDESTFPLVWPRRDTSGLTSLPGI